MPATTDTPTPALEKLYRAATNPIRLMPDFIIIGAQRGGTTSLYNYLAEHPGIGAASIKEVHFFDSRHFAQGEAWYRAHFPTTIRKYVVERARRRSFLTGEASPYYLFHPHAPARVAAMLPGVKLIVMLRNPVDRAYSHYYHEIAGRHEPLPSFEEAIDGEEQRLAGELEKMQADEHYHSFNHRHFSYLARGIYAGQLQNWLRYFPREQLLLLRSEDFYADPRAVFKRTLAFLDLPEVVPQETQAFKQYNETRPPRMLAATRQRLIEYFKPHNERLYDFTGIDFGWER